MHKSTGLFIYTGWCFLCFTSYCWFAPYELAKMNVRLPTIGEEAPLQKLIDDVQSRAASTIPVDLRILESDDYDACATGRKMVVLSKGIIKDFSAEELRGIIAHEIGHLQSKDTMAIAAFYMAGRLHWMLLQITRNVFNAGRFRQLFYFRRRMMLCVLFIFVILFFAGKYIVPAVLTLFYFVAIPYIDRFFKWLWLISSRYREYRQDRFAHQLGYGKAHADGLTKLSKAAPQEVSWFYIIICSTHPVIHHRIRRLEMLEGTEVNPRPVRSG